MWNWSMIGEINEHDTRSIKLRWIIWMLHKFNTNFLILGSKTVGLIKTKQMHFLLLFQIKIPAGCINIFRYHACFPKIFLLSPVRDTRFLSIVQFLSKKIASSLIKTYLWNIYLPLIWTLRLLPPPPPILRLPSRPPFLLSLSVPGFLLQPTSTLTGQWFRGRGGCGGEAQMSWGNELNVKDCFKAKSWQIEGNKNKIFL